MEKILILVPFLSGNGGTETVLKMVLGNKKFLRESAVIDVFIMGSGNNKNWAAKVSSNVNVNFLSKNKLFQFINLGKLLTTGNYSCVICLSTTLLFLTSTFRKTFRLKFKLMSWIHFSLISEKTVNVNKLRLADINLVISSGIFKQFKKLGIPERKLRLVYNPVAPQSGTVSENKDTDVLKLVYVGRITLDGQKNLRELFYALKKVTKINVLLHIYGAGEISKCKEVIRDMGIEHKIIWHGWVKKPWEDIDNIDALVLTSKYEGFPMTLLEALSHGVPVISSNCPTGPEDIVTKSNGFLYKMGDSEELSLILENFKEEFSTSHEKLKNTIAKFYVNEYIETLNKAILEENG